MPDLLTRPPDIDMRVWVQSTPLIVDELCTDAQEVAAWRALDWLMTAFPQRRGFGTREIAEKAHIGRKSLCTSKGGKAGIIDRLIQKGLVEIVGYETVGFPNPRPIYSINHRKLYQASMDAAPGALLRHRASDPPPPPHPDQMTMFEIWYGLESDDPTPGAPVPQDDGHSDKTPQIHGVPGLHADPIQVDMPQPHGAPELHGEPHGASEHHRHGANGLHAGAHGATGLHGHGATRLQKREGEKEGERERGTRTPNGASLPELVRAELRTALAELLPGTLESSAAPARRAAPAAPPDQPPLADHPLDLWHDLYAEPRPFELRQLAALAAEHDQHTGGYGDYWLSKCILSAGLAHEQPTIRLVKAILDRWRASNCYGSDAPAYEKRNGASVTLPANLPPEPAPPDPAPDDTDSHPAVQLYREKTGTQTSAAQARAIAGTVANLDIWQQTLDHWTLNGWRTANVGNLLDAYRKRASDQPTSDAPMGERVGSLEISIAAIHPTDRGTWMHRFNEARTNAEKRQVLAHFRTWLEEQGVPNGTNGTPHTHQS